MDTRSVVQSALDVMLNRTENRMFFEDARQTRDYR